MHNHNCFLLSYTKYGDNDAVLHCFSEESGFQSFFAKGIYSAKNKKKPYLLPLNLLKISVARNTAKNGIFLITGLETASQINDFTGVKSSSILFFVADFLHQVLREEQENEFVFNEIQRFLDEILRENIGAYAPFLIRFLKISGVSPLFTDKKFLNPEAGNFSDEISHHLFDEQVSLIWKKMLITENLYEIRLKRNKRNQFIDSVMIYCHFHFTNFRTPKSLEILRQIYE